MESKKAKSDSIFEWLKSIIFAVIIAFILSNYIIVNAVVPTGSMENTIHVGDRLIANRLAYIFTEPKRGDIIVFDGTDSPEKLFVKRIIGLPNETILMENGSIYIDGVEFLQDYTDIKIIGNFGPFKVPQGMYFMLGDNRNASNDSRYWANKYVAKNTIKGKASFKYFPTLKLFN